MTGADASVHSVDYSLCPLIDVAMPVHLALEHHTLTNGLRVVLHRDARLPLVAINLWYHVGSKHDPPGRTGLAHILEHMLFQGSLHVGRQDHVRLIQQAGGTSNASTWYDRTSYHETLPSNQLELGLWLEADRMGYFLPALSEENLDNQRKVVINERQQRVDNQPYGRAFEELYALLYPAGHPYRSPVIGYPGDLRNVTLDMVREFFTTYYVPCNAVLSLAGDLQLDEALTLSEKYFGSIPPGESVAWATAPIGLDREHRQALEDRVELSRLYVAFHTPPYGDRSWYVADLLAQMLTTGASSLLYRSLVVDRQLALNVQAQVLPTEDSASMWIVVTARPSVDPAEMERALRDHLLALVERPLAKEQIDQAARWLLHTRYHDLQYLPNRADLFARFTTYFGDPNQAADELDRYRSLTPSDVQGFARDYLSWDRKAVLVVHADPSSVTL